MPQSEDPRKTGPRSSTGGEGVACPSLLSMPPVVMTPPSRNVLQKCVLRLAQAAILIMAFVALGNLAGSEWGPLKKLVHFPAHWAPLALGAALTLAAMKRWKWAAGASVLAIGFGVQVAQLWQPVPDHLAATTATQHEAPSQPPLTILSFNVFKNNRQHTTVLTALQNAQADVVYLTEMTPQWFAALAPLQKDYPHRVGKNDHSDWLLSKYPLEKAEVVALTFEAAQTANIATGTAAESPPENYRDAWSRDEMLVATINAHGRKIRIGGVHPPTPTNSSRLVQQRACVALYAQALNADSDAEARVLIGDFNTSSFSPTFRLILDTTGLCNGAAGYGYLPTWGPRLPREPILPWLGIPIDHILASKNISILDYETGPPLGSDHLWVKARITIGASLALEDKSLSHTELNPDQTSSPTPAVLHLASTPK
jgi:endonuclease/exonuclease/phosphatase (EEP) superfamily protein YafD